MSPRGSCSEAGATLVEILVAVVVIGVGFVAILGGLGTSFALSAFHREQARVETELRRYAEAVKAEPYAACSYTPSAFTPAFSAGPDYEIDPPVVTSSVDSGTGTVTSYTATSPCLPSTSLIQVVRLTVRSTKDTRAEETIDVVKRPTS